MSKSSVLLVGEVDNACLLDFEPPVMVHGSSSWREVQREVHLGTCGEI